MRAIIGKEGTLYLSASDIVRNKLTYRDIEKILEDKHKSTGRDRPLVVCTAEEKKELRRVCSELLELYDEETAVIRLCVKFKIKKALVMRWTYDVRLKNRK